MPDAEDKAPDAEDIVDHIYSIVGSRSEQHLTPIKAKIWMDLSGLQWVGVWILCGIGTLILIAMVGIGIDYVRSAPAPIHIDITQVSSSVEEIENMSKVVDMYKELSEISTKRALDTFNAVVSQALIPILTSVLGYIFGSLGKKKSNETPNTGDNPSDDG